MGTPLYMSPEQAQGHQLDHRSDLYSLGVTFYQMLSGQPPFKADSPLALALKHVKDTPVDLSVHRPDLPPDLCRLVMKLMEKDPARRYQSASDMLRDLAKVRDAVQAAQTLAGAPGGLQVSTPAIAIDDTPPLAKAKKARSGPGLRDLFADARVRSRVVAAMLFGGLALGAAAGWSLRPRDLLGEGARSPAALPALWMAPEWSEVPKQPSAELQYRYAQVQAPSGSREAAWLAVPGHFPQAHEWSARAYDQVARQLFRHRDAPRLRVLAAELDKLGRAHEKQLAAVATVGAEVLEGDAEEAITGLRDDFIVSLTDPGLAELALEITLEAERLARRGLSASVAGTLRRLKIRLVQRTVNIMFLDFLGQQINLN
jgi:serine/threonine-protein kinase